mmetsp:Transcript_4462/g.8239  ORF Transcript_4462/g.8239 Transcript_4462/m.8239 type:complete len:84 (+) Transcript_4462:298-549(+)
MEDANMDILLGSLNEGVHRSICRPAKGNQKLDRRQQPVTKTTSHFSSIAVKAIKRYNYRRFVLLPQDTLLTFSSSSSSQLQPW